jgi:hypothetical protein
MANDKKILINRGERTDVQIPVERPPASASPQPASRALLIPADVEEDLYTFRKGITFYDLGTRKTEDGTYAHVAFDSFTLPEDADPFASLRDSYHAAMLAGDFLQPGVCAQLPNESQYLYFDFVFKREEEVEGLFEERELIGKEDTRPFIIDYPDFSAPLPAFVHETDWRGRVLKFKKPDRWSICVESAFHYNPFDTLRTDAFKLTETPDPDAEVAQLEVTSASLLKVYLTPRCEWFAYDPAEFTEYLYTMSRFLPVMPGFEIVKEPIFEDVGLADTGPLEGQIFDALPSVEYWTTIYNYYMEAGHDPRAVSPDISYLTDSGSAQSLFEEGEPVLVAVIVKKGKPYYLWQMVELAGNTRKACRVLNPTS